jgi:four helix bundle protein
MKKSNGFEDLEVWKLGMETAKAVYALTRLFPVEEKYGLVSQLRRSALSVPSNIAEGSARGSDRDFMRFISIALGSAAELKTQVIFCREIGFIKPADFLIIYEEVNRLGRMLRGLHQALAKKYSAAQEDA